jgi:putative transposase
VNHKRVYRLYRDLGLAVRLRRRKRVSQLLRHPKPVPEEVNDRGSADFTLNVNWFTNRVRPHSSLGSLSPEKFAQRALQGTEKRRTGELSATAGQ